MNEIILCLKNPAHLKLLAVVSHSTLPSNCLLLLINSSCNFHHFKKIIQGYPLPIDSNSCKYVCLHSNRISENSSSPVPIKELVDCWVIVALVSFDAPIRRQWSMAGRKADQSWFSSSIQGDELDPSRCVGVSAVDQLKAVALSFSGAAACCTIAYAVST